MGKRVEEPQVGLGATTAPNAQVEGRGPLDSGYPLGGAWALSSLSLCGKRGAKDSRTGSLPALDPPHGLGYGLVTDSEIPADC